MSTGQRLRKSPKVAFFDIDGTLVGKSGSISPRVVAAVRGLSESGVVASLATGRPWFGAREIIDQLQIRDPSMFFSGALVVDPRTGAVLRASAVSMPDATRITDFCREQKLYFEWYAPDSYAVETTSDLTAMHFEYLKVMPRVQKFEASMVSQDIIKIVVVCRDHDEERKIRGFLEAFSRLSVGVGSGAAHPGIRFVNITDADACRDRVFDYFLKRFSVSAEEVLAFGDAEADLPFLERAGWGTAVMNAPEAVRKKARHVCSSVEEDGVAVFIEQLLKGGSL